MALPTVRYVHPEIPSRLRGYVASIVAYDVDVGSAGVHLGLPSTTLTLQLASDGPLRVGWAPQHAAARDFWGMVAGLHTRPAQVTHAGRMTGVEVALTTVGARAVLGSGAAELAGTIAGLDEVNPALKTLVEKVALSRTPGERLAHTMEGLLTLTTSDEVSAVRPEVRFALAHLTRGAKLETVATQTGISRRHLFTLIKGETGLPPATYRQVARLEHSYRALENLARHGHPSLAAVALQAGYADQAHMTRDWALMAGITPARWLRREFPLLQDSYSP